MAATARAAALSARSTSSTPAGIETKNATRWIQPRRRGLTGGVGANIGDMLPRPGSASADVAGVPFQRAGVGLLPGASSRVSKDCHLLGRQREKEETRRK